MDSIDNSDGVKTEKKDETIKVNENNTSSSDNVK